MISKKNLSITAGLTGGFGTGLGLFFAFDPATIMQIMSDTANSKIAQAGFFFTIAAWLHSGRVKKEIKLNFVALTEAINNVANSFREDLAKHGERLDNLAGRVEHLEKSK